MLFAKITVLAVMALTSTAFPHHGRKQTQHSELFIPGDGEEVHIEAPSNASISQRAEKGACKNLELPTAASYKLGYETFCIRHVPNIDAIVAPWSFKQLVFTYMLKTHTGSEIPWIFKIKANDWGSVRYRLQYKTCVSGFRDMIEGEKSKLGKNFCVVEGTEDVLFMGSRVAWERGEPNDNSVFESRKRKGDFDPNDP